MPSDFNLLRQQLVREEATSMRLLGAARRDASTRLPILARTGPLANKGVPAAAVKSKDATKRAGEPR